MPMVVVAFTLNGLHFLPVNTIKKGKLIDVLYAWIETKKGESLTSENIIQGDNDSITGSVLTAAWFWQPGFCLEAIGY